MYTNTHPQGQGEKYYKSSGSMTLHLSNLPEGGYATVSLTLYILNSWDGNGDAHTIGYPPNEIFNPQVSPDTLTFTVGSNIVSQTTFSNDWTYMPDGHPYVYNQSFPSQYPDGNNGPRFGAFEIKHLDEDGEEQESAPCDPNIIDSVYTMSVDFLYEGTSADLVIASTGETFGVADAKANAADVSIAGGDDIWWFDGENPSGYSTEDGLEVRGGESTYRYKWEITAGADKVDVRDGATKPWADVAETIGGIPVDLRTTGASAGNRDITITLSGRDGNKAGTQFVKVGEKKLTVAHAKIHAGGIGAGSS
jgi:hypothetical protein